MPAFGPIFRRGLIQALRQLGFDGPFPGARHESMIRGMAIVRLPNPHRGDVSRDLLAEILRTARISRDECESV
jgi:hypothetical protein